MTCSLCLNEPTNEPTANQQHKIIEVKEILIDRQCCHFVTIASGKCDQNAPSTSSLLCQFFRSDTQPAASCHWIREDAIRQIHPSHHVIRLIQIPTSSDFGQVLVAFRFFGWELLYSELKYGLIMVDICQVCSTCDALICFVR